MPQNPPAPVVLVTGAAKRLGREIALALAAGGWRVAVHYRSSEQDAIDTVAACARIQGDSALFDADLGDETAVKGLLPRVVERFGQVDAVVNSASAFEQDDVARDFVRTALNSPAVSSFQVYVWSREISGGKQSANSG